MRKIIFIFALAIVAMLSSCNSGYDQKKVDALDINNPTKEVYSEMVKQAKFALDDAENAKDLSIWEKENQKEAESMASLVLALTMCEDSDPDFPKELRKDVKDLQERVGKLMNKMGNHEGMNDYEMIPEETFDSVDSIDFVDSVYIFEE